MKPDLQRAIVKAASSLKNPAYFLQDPTLYTFNTYFRSCPDGASRKAAENDWRQKLIRNLKKSGNLLLTETGSRLERAWQADRGQRQADHHDERSRHKRAAFLQSTLDDHREAIITHSTQKLPRDLQELVPIPPEPVSQQSRSMLATSLSSSTLKGSQMASSSSNHTQTLATFDDAMEYFGQAKALQDVVLDTSQEGDVVPAWARDRPLWRFCMSVDSVDYGPSITTWYNDSRADGTLDFHNVDKIALLSAILHLYDQHHALNKAAIAFIRNNTLDVVYTTEDEDKSKAKAAATRWNQWVMTFRTLVFEEKQLAQKEGRDPRPVPTNSLVKDILSSFDLCEQVGILPFFFAGLNTFRKYNNWKIPKSEMSWTTSVVVPILEEFMFAQHEVIFTCTSAGNIHEVRGSQKEQPSQPNVIELADEGETEVYYGEIKVAKASLEEQHLDRL